MGIPSELKYHITSAKEEILWHSQPVKPGSSSTFKPVMSLLLALAILFFGFAAYIIMIDMPVGHPNALRNLFISLTVAVFFLAIWFYLPTTMDLQPNNTFYVVTNQRAMIIEHNPKDPSKSKISEWGAGDLSDPSVKPGMIWFTEAALDQGKTEKGARKPIGWTGFAKLPASEEEKAKAAINKLLDPKEAGRANIVENKTFKFSFKRPIGWSIRTFNIPDSHRDNVLFTTLAGDAIEQYSLLQGAKITPGWNTAVLTKRLSSSLKPDSGSLHYVTILVEALVTDKTPKDGHETFDAGASAEYKSNVMVKDFFTQKLQQSMLICEFRKGIKITGDTLSNLEGKLYPKGVVKMLGPLKDREFSMEEEKQFLEFVQTLVGKKSYFTPNKKAILEYSKLENPIKRIKDTSDYKLFLNKNAKKKELNITNSFEMNSSITIMENQYNIWQLYSNVYLKLAKKNLHLRYTMFCTHKEITVKNAEGKDEKTTVFDQNKKVLEDIARSTVITVPKLLQSN